MFSILAYRDSSLLRESLDTRTELIRSRAILKELMKLRLLDDNTPVLMRALKQIREQGN